MSSVTGGLAANGAIPKNPIIGFFNNLNSNLTPASTKTITPTLGSNNMSSKSPTLGNVTGVLSPNNPMGVGTSAQNLVQKPPVVQHQTPTTPVKSIVTPDGTTSTYHAPTTLAPDDASNKFNTSTGQPNPNYKDPNAPQKDNTGNTINANGSTSNTSYTPPNQGTTGISQGGLIGNLVDKSNTPSQAYTDATNAYQQAIDSNKKLQMDYNAKIGDIEGAPGIALEDKIGRERAYAQENAANLSASQGAISEKATALGAANTQQSTQQGALTSAISANAPTGNIINVSPTTGLPIAGGSLGDLAKTAGTISGLQSGAAAQAATGGNIAAQNATTLGTAATGANASSISNFTNQNNIISNSTAKLDNIAQGNNSSGGLIANMGTTGFNPTSSPIGNQTYAQYFTEKNPGAKAGIEAGLGEIKNQISNVIASSTGLTPTGVTAVADQYDLTALNPQQLNDFLLYIKSYAQSNIAANQDSVNRLTSGGQIDTNRTPLPAPIPNSTGQAALGTGATLAEGFINKLLGQAGNAVAGAVGGATSGLAQSVLGL